MVKKDLKTWLEWIRSTHPKEMDLGLERVKKIAERLDVLNPESKVIIVGGTNGKGSCVAGLETIYLSEGYKVGAFTSPFLFEFREQVRLQGESVSEDELCKAFEKIAEVCDKISLTPFEYTTLAACLIFKAAALDVWILEVGLGGRFDAVNILDADVALIASIDIDHAEILGGTREAIAKEKAGIFREDKPAVCGDFNPPETLLAAKSKELYCQGREFGFVRHGDSWDWWSQKQKLTQLPLPSLALQNMATVLMGVELLPLPVSRRAIDEAFKKITLPGRIQVVPGKVTTIYDVSHNPASAKFLAEYLKNNPCKGKTHAVFSMLADKDMVSTLEVIKDQIDSWDIAPLETPRAASKEMLSKSLDQANVSKVTVHDSIKAAHASALAASSRDDRVVVFGSFHTVAEAKC